MKIRGGGKAGHSHETRKSGFGHRAKQAEKLEFSASLVGQLCPQDCPPATALVSSSNPLGDAMDVDAVAEMLGCSPWTIRQTYLRQGLPHLRASARGQLVFFKNQVIRWIVTRQQKGVKR